MADQTNRATFLRPSRAAKTRRAWARRPQGQMMPCASWSAALDQSSFAPSSLIDAERLRLAFDCFPFSDPPPLLLEGLMQGQRRLVAFVVGMLLPPEVLVFVFREAGDCIADVDDAAHAAETLLRAPHQPVTHKTP